ncbi:hypothetical protein GQ473_00180, partial [archaeon]|nr:hypothetical protein [archaeon]
ENSINTTTSESPALTQNIWYQIKAIHTGSEVSGYIDENQINGTISTNVPVGEEMGFFILDTVGTFEQDWCFVREYASTDPTHGAWGNEETDGGPAVGVDVQYLPILTPTIDTAITNARTGANNKYFNVPIVNDIQIMFIHISQ